MGSLYLRGNVLWAKYYRVGRPIRESTGCQVDQEKQAKDFLKRREGDVAAGRPVSPRASRVRVSELLEDLKTEYKTNDRKNLDHVERITKRLDAALGNRRAHDLTAADVRAYISRRQAEKAANATINRELSALRRAFNVALADEKILRKPHFPMLTENNVRTGFIGAVEYLALHEALPAPLSHVLEFAYTFGWRKSEILGLTWDRVDFQAGTVRLDPGTTKNREGRVVVLTDSLKVTFRKLWDDTRALAERKGAPIPWVFHRGGKPIRDMRGTWEKACRKVGLTGLKLHDLRRSAVRRMEQCGIPRSVAMKLTGHKTEAVYRRYAIVSEGDLADATRKLTGESVPISIPGTVSGTVGRREGWSASERDE